MDMASSLKLRLSIITQSLFSPVIITGKSDRSHAKLGSLGTRPPWYHWPASLAMSFAGLTKSSLHSGLLRKGGWKSDPMQTSVLPLPADSTNSIICQYCLCTSFITKHLCFDLAHYLKNDMAPISDYLYSWSRIFQLQARCSSGSKKRGQSLDICFHSFLAYLSWI